MMLYHISYLFLDYCTQSSSSFAKSNSSFPRTHEINPCIKSDWISYSSCFRRSMIIVLLHSLIFLLLVGYTFGKRISANGNLSRRLCICCFSRGMSISLCNSSICVPITLQFDVAAYSLCNHQSLVELEMGARENS